MDQEPISCWPPASPTKAHGDDSSDKSPSHTSMEDRGCNTQMERDKLEIVPLKKRKLTSNTRWRLQEEVLANISLARWWRSTGQKLCHKEECPNSTNPNTILKWVASTKEAQSFMKQEAQRLQHVLTSSGEDARVRAALGSIFDRLGDTESALQHLTTAVQLDSSVGEFRWLLHKVKRQLQVKDNQHAGMWRLKQSQSAATSGMPQPQKVARKSANSLSFPEFFFHYAMTGTPVVITDLAEKMTSVPWTWHHIRKVAGDCQATLKKLVCESAEWARLEDSRTTTVTEFLDSLESGQEHNEYLFDWSLPIHCPGLAQQLVIPQYFANDFLQRAAPGSLYRDSWPSLFIAPGGLRSELHVDAFGSNFWMALFEGRKRWLFFKAKEQALLYPQYECSMDPVFEVDLAHPDLHRHPLLRLTQPVECILHPGEVLFVPAGCPHRVENLETSLAISANFVDLSNVALVQKELQVNGLLDPRSTDLLKQMDSSHFSFKMKSNIGNVSWTEFKQWPKDFSSYDY